MIDKEDPQAKHREAMAKAEEAYFAKQRGDAAAANRLFADALQAEQEVALRYRDSQDFEPTRSILFRSAASLALEIGDLSTAAFLASEGCRGRPLDRIREELSMILQEIKTRLCSGGGGHLSDIFATTIDGYRSGDRELAERDFASALKDATVEFQVLAYQALWEVVDSMRDSEAIAREALRRPLVDESTILELINER